MTSRQNSTGPAKETAGSRVVERESFFQRWSRRKLDRCTSGECQEQSPLDGDLSVIDFDALDFNSNFSRFMLPQIPHSVRSKALRKLWASNAAFTQPDGLQDYAKDYTDAAARLSDAMGSLYRVGRGFLTDAEFAAWAELAIAPRGCKLNSQGEQGDAGQSLREQPPRANKPQD